MSMFSSIIDDAKKEFISGTTVTRLILINVAIYVIVNLLYVFLRGINPEVYTTVIRFLAVPADLTVLIYKFWTILTNMFLHEGFFHILWNMLFLFWFGRIVGDLLGDRKILPLYILGGLAGTIFFIGSAYLLSSIPVGAYALGASGAVMAIVVASGVLAPEYEMRLILIGNVKLKYIVMVLVFLDVVGAAGDINTGGHFAHIGGALMGWLYISGLRSGRNYGLYIEQFEDWVRDYFYRRTNAAPRRGQFTIVHSKKGTEGKDKSKSEDLQEEVDRILDKIKLNGYDSLTDSEKETLFQASKD